MSESNKRSGRRLSDEEEALWQGIARSIKPLKRPAVRKPSVAVLSAETPARAKATRPRPEKQTQAPAPRIAPQPPPPKPIAPFDRRTKQKLARGRETIDAKIDLHGMTQTEAHGALGRFLRRSQAAGCRFVLVVTGKGVRGDGETRGVLRRKVPQWLALPEFRELVVGFEAAHVGHGGEGALYVRLRRSR